VFCVYSRVALIFAITNYKGKEQTPSTTKTTAILSSKGNSINKPQYKGNTTPLATFPSPSTLGDGFTLAISPAPSGIGADNVVALHSHLSVPVWSLIQQ